jgi:hypothetical protein
MSTTSVEPATPASYVPSRRTVLRAAAWTAPAVSVAVAVPAYAACSTAQAVTASYLLDWGVTPWSQTSSSTGVATVASLTAGAAAVPVTFVSNGPQSLKLADANLIVPAQTNVGGLGASARALQLHHAAALTAGRNAGQVVTINFARQVSGLSFTITDIDSQERGWWDQVSLSGARRGQRASGVRGAGTDDSPWRQREGSSAVGATSGAGNVRVSYTEPVSSIVLKFWTTVTGGTQLINLTDFSFTASSC